MDLAAILTERELGRQNDLTAIHEAGHAVVALLSPLHVVEFAKVTLGLPGQPEAKDGDSVGFTHYHERDESVALPAALSAGLISAAAGPLAEVIMLSPPGSLYPKWREIHDAEFSYGNFPAFWNIVVMVAKEARHGAITLPVSAKAMKRVQRAEYQLHGEVFSITRELLAAAWPAVEMVAKELGQVGKLQGERIAEITRDTLGDELPAIPPVGGLEWRQEGTAGAGYVLHWRHGGTGREGSREIATQTT